jgi:hypothetical protein
MKLIERASQIESEDIPVSTIANLAKAAVDMERLALGKPTDITQHQDADDEMEKMIKENLIYGTIYSTSIMKLRSGETRTTLNSLRGANFPLQEVSKLCSKGPVSPHRR